jgi:hypothetical protein
MAKSNDWDGYCYECRTHVPAHEGVKVHDPDAPRGYKILCVECAPAVSVERPSPPEASKLPSIHRGEEQYER